MKLFRPDPTETVPTTPDIPIMIPSMVNKERILFLRRDDRPIMSPSVIFHNCNTQAGLPVLLKLDIIENFYILFIS